MTIEEKLRLYIVERYLTIANFCNNVGLLPQTMSAIFRRGLSTCTAGTLQKICKELAISMDGLLDGVIEPCAGAIYRDFSDYDYIFDKMLIDGEELSEYEKFNLKQSFHNNVDLIKENRKMFFHDGLLVYDHGSKVVIYNRRTHEQQILPREDAINLIVNKDVDFSDIEFVNTPDPKRAEYENDEDGEY